MSGRSRFSNRRDRDLCVALSLVLLTVGVLGCGKKSDVVVVRGRATYRGEAIARGAATFFPATGRPITAAISEEGDYTAELPPGEYTVIVNLGFTPPPGFKEGDPMPKPKFVLPPEYTTRAKSRLTASIKPGQDQPIDFALE